MAPQLGVMRIHPRSSTYLAAATNAASALESIRVHWARAQAGGGIGVEMSIEGRARANDPVTSPRAMQIAVVPIFFGLGIVAAISSLPMS